MFPTLDLRVACLSPAEGEILYIQTLIAFFPTAIDNHPSDILI